MGVQDFPQDFSPRFLPQEFAVYGCPEFPRVSLDGCPEFPSTRFMDVQSFPHPQSFPPGFHRFA